MTDSSVRPRTAAATEANVEKRRRSAVERRAVEEFAPNVGLLSDRTLWQLTELLVAHCHLRGFDVARLLD